MSELVTRLDQDSMMNQGSPTESDHDVLHHGMKEHMNKAPKRIKPLVLFVIVAILAGIGTGYLFSQRFAPNKTSTQVAQEGPQMVEGSKVVVGQTYGSTDSSTFKDSVEGVLLKGGVNGEGSHHIVREGGESQNVYLTSSIVDLDIFENSRVVVNGETFQAQRAGWLMDVGQVKVLELNAKLPDWVQQTESADQGDE